MGRTWMKQLNDFVRVDMISSYGNFSLKDAMKWDSTKEERISFAKWVLK